MKLPDKDELFMLRRKHNLTMKELAERSGTTKGKIESLEYGRGLDYRDYIKLCEYFINESKS